MKKATLHYILDGVEGLILLCLVVSGFVLWFALPEGSAADKTIWFNRYTWKEIHHWLAVGLLVFFSTHIITHWTWITYMTKSYFKRFNKA